LNQNERSRGILNRHYDLVDAVLPQLKTRHGDWDSFAYFAPKEIGFMEAELAGTKRLPSPAAD